MNILLTGGAGFIGSHTAVELLNAGHSVVVVDNLYNSSEKSLERVQELTGKTSDAEFAEMLGLSDGRYRYLKRHPGMFKLGEICLIRKLAEQYGFRIDFDMDDV